MANPSYGEVLAIFFGDYLGEDAAVVFQFLEISQLGAGLLLQIIIA
jgi:hypothetical protein